jgi:hypothetical protein
LIRQYVDPDKLFHWLSEVKRVSTYNRGIIAMDMQTVAYQKVESNPRASRRRGGACMRMVTYRAFPQPTVSLHSRTTYLGYIGELDLLLAHKLIELAADMIGDGLSVDDFAFRWKVEVAQVHGFKSLAFIFATGQDKYMRMREWPEGKRIRLAEGRVITLGSIDDHPTWKIVRSWWKRIHGQDKALLPYSANKYGAEKRIRRRYHSQMGIDQTPFLNGENPYVPLSTPIGEITLDRMLYKTPESRAVIRKAKKEKSEKLVTDLFDDDDLDWLPGSEDFADMEEDEVEDVH